MPFGAVASVYAWHRLGGAVAAIISSLLFLPLDRYVGDLFWVDFASTSAETRNLVVELVNLLGLKLDEDKTPLPADSMAVLGVLVQLVCEPGGGLLVDLLPDTPKVQFWLAELRRLSTAASPSQLEVQSLVGRLSFAVSAAYGPSCRGRLRPLFDWSNTGGGPRSFSVDAALSWWMSRLATPAPRRLRLIASCSPLHGRRR